VPELGTPGYNTRLVTI